MPASLQINNPPRKSHTPWDSSPKSTYPSTTPSANAHRSSAHAPNARNCAQPTSGGGTAVIAMIASDNDEEADGCNLRSPHHAPPPRSAEKRTPVAWLTTNETAGPSSSTKHNDVANHGRPRLAFVEPSMGSITTTSPVDVGLKPLSSDNTPTPARFSTASAASSAVTSRAYCPTRVPDGPKSVTVRIAAATASATSCNSPIRSAIIVAHGSVGSRGSHRCRRFRLRVEEPRGRSRLPCARRAPLRRDLLAPPVVGGRSPSGRGLQRPDRPASVAGSRSAGTARFRGRGHQAG